MKKQNHKTGRNLFLVRTAIMLLLFLLVHLSAWAQQTYVNIVDRQAIVTKYSTLYVGEVVLDGQQTFYYLYSEDMSNDEIVFAAVRSALSVFKDGKYRALVPDMIGGTEELGIAVCSNAAYTSMMNDDWKSADKAGLACLPNTTVVSSSSDNLFETNAYFSAKCVSDFENVYEGATLVDDVGQDAAVSGILGCLTTTNSDDVKYEVENGTLAKHIYRTVNYTCELTTVIYTRVELESPSMASTPLTIEATSEGDITFSITYSYDHPVVLTPIEYQVNGGTWTTYSSWPADAAGITSSTGNWPVTFGDGIHVNAGDKVAFRGTNASYHGNGNGYECHITSTADGYVYGNVMSLIDADNYATLKILTGDWNFGYLFCAGYNDEYAPITNTTIKSHPENDLVLPATTITPACYFGMFAGCLGLTRAPELPATTLEAQCYAEMFRATGLTVAPELPATEMRPDYYNSPDDYSFGTMDCYMQMFQDCTSLTEAPELPATTLAHGVYQNMFQGCTSLQKAPVLPAAKVADGAYYRMFYGCTSLNYVKCLATDIGEEWAVEEWVGNVSSTGTFVKTYGMTSWQTGDSGIPAGWTVNESVTLNSDDEGNYWATFYSDASYTADENTTVYTAKVSGDQSKVELTEVDDKTIPAGNAVVLKSTATTATMTHAEGASGTLADNDLQGSSSDIATPANTYMLVKGSSGVGFYHWTEANIPACRGYLTLNSTAAARAFLCIGTNDGSTTAIARVRQVNEDNGSFYDVTGRRLTTTPSHGIYVKNGKKVVIK